MNRLSIEERCRVVSCLVEGNSLRSTVRMTGTHRTTILKLLADLGKACADYHDKNVRNLKSKRIECDEIWAFCGAKAKNATAEQKAEGWGDVWTWTAIDADSKLIPSWFVGGRDSSSAYHFMHDLASRLSNRVQLTTDGHRAYVEAVESALGSEVDYAMLIKIFGNVIEGESRYSPPICIGIRKSVISGQPNKKLISTSYVERQNLTMRMSIRRFTRLTNAFSKKIENHAHALALYFMFYNFARIHSTLRVTPAMEAGIADHVWSIREIVQLLDL